MADSQHTPYYSDESVTLYRGRCEDILPAIQAAGSVHLVTDPPYFKVKDADWDNQWEASSEFLDWMGIWLDLAAPRLSPDASVWVFASPELTSAVESVVAQRFRVLNSVRWIKEQGWHQKSDLAAARSFLSPWEGIIFAERFADAYGDASLALHKTVFAPLGRYIQQERERAGVTRSDLEVALGYTSTSDPTRGTALAYRWEEGSSLPAADTYQKMRAVLGEGYLRREYEDLRREYEDLRREYEDLRRPFTVKRRELSTDVFAFPTVPPYPGKHPCEKPLGLIAHIIETTTRPGDTILDPFAGSGAILDAARSLGRKAIGIEMDDHWCRQISARLSQDVLDFGGAA
jgi:adenine-specific DNA-methyltransferase